MKIGAVVFLSLWLLSLAAGCKPAQNNTITGGGKGGNVTIKIMPEFFGSVVDTCTVYIKYGSLDAPMNGVYDDSAVCVFSGDTSAATFSGLTPGLYYFLGDGIHSEGGHPPNVRGSKNCTIQNDGSYAFYLPTNYYIP